MTSATITLDVREELRQGRDPFAKIMGVVAGIAMNERLEIIAPFEPVPLYHVLGQRGFTHSTRQQGPSHWEVLFTRTAEAVEPTINPAPAVSTACASTVELDARQLEPPLPMVRILEALSTLPPDSNLRARTDRRPIHLYPQLADRGFVGHSEEQNDGTFLTHIRRA